MLINRLIPLNQKEKTLFQYSHTRTFFFQNRRHHAPIRGQQKAQAPYPVHQSQCPVISKYSIFHFSFLYYNLLLFRVLA